MKDQLTELRDEIRGLLNGLTEGYAGHRIEVREPEDLAMLYARIGACLNLVSVLEERALCLTVVTGAGGRPPEPTDERKRLGPRKQWGAQL